MQDLLKKVRTGKRPISIPEKAFMQKNHQGTYFPVSGEVVPIFANEKMTGMAIVCRNISEEEMQRRFFNMAGGGKLHLSVAVQHAYEPFPFPGWIAAPFRVYR